MFLFCSCLHNLNDNDMFHKIDKIINDILNQKGEK